MLKKSEEIHKESQIRNTNRYRNTRKYFTLSQKIALLITVVVFVALLPSSLFTTQRVAQVIYDRVSINAVSINNILCHSDEIIDSRVKNAALMHHERCDGSGYPNRLTREEIDDFDNLKGYGVIFLEGVALGGFKASNGRLKNYYPKGLITNLGFDQD